MFKTSFLRKKSPSFALICVNAKVLASAYLRSFALTHIFMTTLICADSTVRTNAASLYIPMKTIIGIYDYKLIYSFWCLSEPAKNPPTYPGDSGATTTVGHGIKCSLPILIIYEEVKRDERAVSVEDHSF